MEAIIQLEQLELSELEKLRDKYLKIKSIVEAYIELKIMTINIHHLNELTIAQLDEKIEKLEIITEIMNLKKEINNKFN